LGVAIDRPRSARPQHARLSRGGALAAGVPAGLAGGAALLATAMTIAEISAEPTSNPGVYSSAWTPVTGIATLVLGADAVRGSFQLGPILLGAAIAIAYAIAAGVVGTALLVWVQGPLATAAGAAIQGMAYALALEIVVVNVLINALQDVNVLYYSMPAWGWWVAHAAYGAVLGLVGARAAAARAVTSGPAR
jgi:hypothetical protein